MNDIIKFECSKRESFGTSASRKIRKDGLIPVTLLTRSSADNIYLSISERELSPIFEDPCIKAKKIELSLGNKKYYVLLHTAEFDAVTDKVISAEFIETNFDEFNLVSVPVKISNKNRCVGVRLGGSLIVPTYDVKIYAKLNDQNYQDYFDIDVTELKVNQSIKLSDIKLSSCFKIKEDIVLVRVSGRKALEGLDGKEEQSKDAKK